MSLSDIRQELDKEILSLLLKFEEENPDIYVNSIYVTRCDELGIGTVLHSVSTELRVR